MYLNCDMVTKRLYAILFSMNITSTGKKPHIFSRYGCSIGGFPVGNVRKATINYVQNCLLRFNNSISSSNHLFISMFRVSRLETRISKFFIIRIAISSLSKAQLFGSNMKKLHQPFYSDAIALMQYCFCESEQYKAFQS